MANPTADVPDRVAKKQLKKFRESTEEEVEEIHMQFLNIMPMMDMMTILLVFLIKQFAVQSSAAAMNKEMQLPLSSADKQRPMTLNITITQNTIVVEGDAVAPVRNGSVDPSMKKDGANSYFIIPLVDTLTHHANRLKKLANMGGSPFDGTAMVMVDKNTPYRLLSEVLYSAGQAEFNNYHMVVIKKSQ